jgi:16S rRNA C1402 (ribose-2'-O) methylase RsmI
MVIIVEGKTDNNEEISDEDIIKKYEYFVQNGMKSKDAIKVTSDELKIKKNYVYDLVIQHKNK